jgi:uncharacterized protein DUF4340
MTVRGTLGLAIVFGLLVAWLLATTRSESPVADNTRALTPPLDDATVVEIAAGSRTMRFVRQEGRWSQSGVSDLLDALASLRVLALIDPDPADPASYGFGADALRLRIAADAKDLTAIEVGAMNPAETGVYVRLAGQRPVLLVGALLRWELEKVRRVASETATP